MKNIAIGVLLVTTLIFGSLYLTQNRKTSEAEGSAASLREKLADAENRAAQQEQRTATLQTRLHDTQAKAVAKINTPAQREIVLRGCLTLDCGQGCSVRCR